MGVLIFAPLFCLRTRAKVRFYFGWKVSKDDLYCFQQGAVHLLDFFQNFRLAVENIAPQYPQIRFPQESQQAYAVGLLTFFDIGDFGLNADIVNIIIPRNRLTGEGIHCSR